MSRSISSVTVKSMLVLTLPILFALFSYFFLVKNGERYDQQYQQGLFVKWKPLGKPPAFIDQVWALDMYGEVITVQTVDGKLYQASPIHCSKPSTACWVEQSAIEQATVRPYYVFPKCTTNYKQRNDLPSPIAQCASYLLQGFDIYREIHYAILEDNSVWYWHFGSGSTINEVSSTDYVALLFPCPLLMIGMIASILLTIVLRRRITYVASAAFH